MENNGFQATGILGLCKSPWIALAFAGIVLFATCGIQQATSTAITPLIFFGILAATVGVAIRPGNPLVLLAGGVCALLVIGSLPLDWDSLHLLFLVLAVASVVSSAIVALPRGGRRTAVSFLIIFHFAGIVCAFTNVAPAPWISSYLWAHCYHYYLNFISMTNPCHFFAPEPAPSRMLWFYVRYDDGSGQWLKVPTREDYRWQLNFQRRLSLPDHVNQSVNVQSLPGEDAVRARIAAGNRDGIPFYYGQPRPTDYKFANTASQIMLGSYVRHIAAVLQHSIDPERQISSIKAYRISHRMLSPREIALGMEPDKKWTYLPYFQGEFDTDGKLLDLQDPYRYWLIPIVNKKNPYLSSGELVSPAALQQDNDILDCLEIHAKLPTAQPSMPTSQATAAPPNSGQDTPKARQK